MTTETRAVVTWEGPGEPVVLALYGPAGEAVALPLEPKRALTLAQRHRHRRDRAQAQLGRGGRRRADAISIVVTADVVAETILVLVDEVTRTTWKWSSSAHAQFEPRGSLRHPPLVTLTRSGG